MLQDAGDTLRRTIFVVDDDESVGLGLVSLLKASGYAARAFPSAETFLNETPSTAWDLGVVDVNMPGMDGLALAEHLNSHGAPPPGLLVITGQPTAEVRSRAAAAAVRDVLSKPLDPTEIVAAVRLALLTA